MRATPVGAPAAPTDAPLPRQIPRTRAAPPADQPDRKLNILLAAERLFSQHGYHGVSIRDIAQEAGVPLALVGYHYGAKHELYEAVFESWLPMTERRLDRLAKTAAADPASHRLDRLLEAFIVPLLDLHRHPEGRAYALMVARDVAAPVAESDPLHRRYFDPMAHSFIDALCGVFPRASRGEIAWCYQFMLGAVLHFVTDRRVERLSKGENAAADPAAQGHLLRFVEAGFQAVLDAPRH